jgi:hypothetical protein
VARSAGAEEEDQQRDSEAAYQPERDPTPANAEEDGCEHHRKLYPEEHVQLPSLGPCRSAFARPRSASSATSGGGGLGLKPLTKPSQRSPDPLPVEHIQSLSDLAQSYSVVPEMSVVPFALQDILRLEITTAARASRSASRSSRH